jgi:phage regulator Rha-like protein
MNKIPKQKSIVPVERIERSILLIRGERVLLDSDLAGLYGVTVKRLNEQVRRNLKRFPKDFMFQLTKEEYRVLRSQIATLKTGRGRHRKYLPYAFTEHGAVMLASVLNSPVAIRMSIFVVRAFVRLRELLKTHKELARKLIELEQRIAQHDETIQSVIRAIRQLMEPPRTEAIGFRVEQDEDEK